MKAIENPHLVLCRTARRVGFGLGVMTALSTAGIGAQDRPVVFVHGLMENGTFWRSLQSYVGNTFRATTIAPTLSWAKTTYDQSSQLHSALGSWRNAVAISHSNGSSVTRRYIQRFGSYSKISQHLAIGGPHRGSELAESLVDGRILWWAGTVFYYLLDTWRFFLDNDYANQYDEDFNDVMDIAEDLAFVFFDQTSFSSLEQIIARLLGAGTGVIWPAIAELRPGSTTYGNSLYGINGAAGLNVERRVTGAAGRVSISTVTKPYRLPWSVMKDAPSTPDGLVDAIEGATWVTGFYALGMCFYYSQHPDAFLRHNAFRWCDTASWLDTVPLYYHFFIGALRLSSDGEFLLPLESDGLLSASTTTYPSGTRHIRVTGVDIRHAQQQNNELVQSKVDNVLASNFLLVRRNAPTPPPPPPGECPPEAVLCEF